MLIILIQLCLNWCRMHFTNNLRSLRPGHLLSRKLSLRINTDLPRQKSLHQLLNIIIMFVKLIIICFQFSHLPQNMHMGLRRLRHTNLCCFNRNSYIRFSLRYRSQGMFDKRNNMCRCFSSLWKLCRIDSSLPRIQRN